MFSTALHAARSFRPRFLRHPTFVSTEIAREVQKFKTAMSLWFKSLPLLISAWITAAQAAPVVTLTGPTSVGTGGAASLTVGLSGSAGTGMAAPQFTVTPPSGITLGAPVLAPAWGRRGLLDTCGPKAYVVVNSKTVTPTIADGTVATIPLTVSQSCAPGAASFALSTIAATSQGYDASATVGGVAINHSAAGARRTDLHRDDASLSRVLLLLPQRPDGQFGPIGDADLPENADEILLDRAFGKVQLEGDLLAEFRLLNQFEGFCASM